MMEIILHRLPRPTSRGYRYECWWNGELLTISRDPEHSACRKLAELGHAGLVYFRRRDRAQYDSCHSIKRSALRSVSENEKHAPRFTKYNSYWIQDDRRSSH